MTDAFSPSMALPPRLSPSALNRYRLCPKQFFLSDIERVVRENEPSPVLAQANAIHEALDKFFGLPSDARAPENLDLALRAAWRRHRGNNFSNRDDEIHFGRAALSMLHSFAERFDLSVTPLAREQWAGVRIDGIELFGKIDRIDAGRLGGIDLIDYKTGRVALDVGDLPREPAVQIYVLAAESKFRTTVERVRLIYLGSGTEVVWEPEREDVEELARRVVKLLGTIRGDTTFAAAPGSHCRFCPFALRCPERQAVSLDDLIAEVGREALPF